MLGSECHHDWYSSAYAPPDHCLKCGVTRSSDGTVGEGYAGWWGPLFGVGLQSSRVVSTEDFKALLKGTGVLPMTHEKEEAADDGRL